LADEKQDFLIEKIEKEIEIRKEQAPSGYRLKSRICDKSVMNFRLIGTVILYIPMRILARSVAQLGPSVTSRLRGVIAATLLVVDVKKSCVMAITVQLAGLC
jgi:hypothetical protein